MSALVAGDTCSISRQFHESELTKKNTSFVFCQDPIASSLSIMRRMPPNKVEQNLSGLLNLAPAHTDELLQRVDQPLEEVLKIICISVDNSCRRSFVAL